MFKVIFSWIVKASCVLVTLLVSIWLVGFSLYVLAPSNLTANVYEGFSDDLDEAYKPTVRWISKTYKLATRSRLDYDQLPQIGIGQSTDPVFGAIQIWSSVCGALGSDQTALGNLTFSMTSFSNNLDFQRRHAKANVDATESLNRSFSLLAISLGLLTTVFAGLNSSEYAQAGSKYALKIKFFAILFPACVTAAAAINSLYAGPEIATKQTQAYAGLVNLGIDASSQLSGSKCPQVTEDFIILNKSVNELNRRLVQLSSGADKAREKAETPKEK